MKVRGCLRACNVEELKDIARNRMISGFSILNKAELVELIAQNISKRDSTESALEAIPNSASFMLQIVSRTPKNEVGVEQLKAEFLQMYSNSTFYSARDTLMRFGFLFEFWENDECVYLAPTEIAKFIKVEDISTWGVVEEDEEEIKTIASFEDLLEYASKNALKDLLDETDLKKSGNKPELIERIVDESGFTPNYILERLFSKQALKDLCIELDLPSSGDKTTLIDRITTKFGLKPVPKRRAVTTEEKIEKKEKMDLFKEVCAELKKYSPYRPRDEGDIEREIFGTLRTKFEPRGISVVGQSIGVRRGKTLIPDIVVGKQVAVELKYIKQSSEYQRVIGQAVQYQQMLPYVVVYCYDPHDKCGEPISGLKNVKIIIKRA